MAGGVVSLDAQRLKRLGQLTLVGPSFDPAERLNELAALLAPLRTNGQTLPQPSVKRVEAGPSTAGIWFMRGGNNETWVLKQVRSKGLRAGLPSDVERCDALLQHFPGLLTDPTLAFPLGTVRLEARDGVHVGDLLISRHALGDHLGLFFARLKMNVAGDQRRLEKLCEDTGALLADFHTRYADPVSGEATHHTDFHPTNVLFDEPTGALTIVDLSGMGTWGPRDDVEKFARIMRQMAGERYAKAFVERYYALVRVRALVEGRVAVDTASSSKPLYKTTSLSAGIDGLYPAFRHLSRLIVPKVSTFDPYRHRASLCWLLSPHQELPLATIALKNAASTEAGKQSPSEWILNAGDDQGSCWSFCQVSGQHGKAERFEALVDKFPALLSDERLEFPCAFIPLCEAGSDEAGSLFVARALKGVPLSQANLAAGRLEEVCVDAGKLLADFHKKYTDPRSGTPVRHGGFRPSSLILDEETGALGIAELWNMGLDGRCDEDVEQFARMLRVQHGERHTTAFLRSYAKRSGSLSKRDLDVGLPGQPQSYATRWLCGAFDIEDKSDSGSEDRSDYSEEDFEHGPICSVM